MCNAYEALDAMELDERCGVVVLTDHVGGGTVTERRFLMTSTRTATQAVRPAASSGGNAVARVMLNEGVSLAEAMARFCGDRDGNEL